MEPILTEKYILTKESYFGFTLDQNKKTLEKNKKNITYLSFFQIILGMGFLVMMLFNRQNTNYFLILLAAAMVLTGFMGSKRLKGYDKKIKESLESSYATRAYGENSFTVKFYEDYLTYTIEEQNGNLKYDDFAACYDGKDYFAIHFTTGELIIFNKTCQIKRIHDILVGYKENQKKSAEYEENLDAHMENISEENEVNEDNEAVQEAE